VRQKTKRIPTIPGKKKRGAIQRRLLHLRSARDPLENITRDSSFIVAKKKEEEEKTLFWVMG